MRNIETFPSKQMYLYLSLVEREVAEFYHNIDRRSWLVWVKMTYFHRFFRTIPGVLVNRYSWKLNLSTWWPACNELPRPLHLPIRSQLENSRINNFVFGSFFLMCLTSNNASFWIHSPKWNWDTSDLFTPCMLHFIIFIC